MTFQAYIANIQKTTGKTPDDFHVMAKKHGLIGARLTASRLVDWLKKEFGLGHGHAMAIWAVFKSKGWATSPAKKGKPRDAGSRRRG